MFVVSDLLEHRATDVALTEYLDLLLIVRTIEVSEKSESQSGG